MTDSIITVNIESNAGGSVALRLYAHDQMLADAPATLACETTVTVPSSGIFTEIMSFDPSKIEQVGQKWHDMVDPSLNVSIDASQSDLTYSPSGPVFGLKPGDSADLKLQAKVDK
jgi:hypothetical protein